MCCSLYTHIVDYGRSWGPVRFYTGRRLFPLFNLTSSIRESWGLGFRFAYAQNPVRDQLGESKPRTGRIILPSSVLGTSPTLVPATRPTVLLDLDLFYATQLR